MRLLPLGAQTRTFAYQDTLNLNGRIVANTRENRLAGGVVTREIPIDKAGDGSIISRRNTNTLQMKED